MKAVNWKRIAQEYHASFIKQQKHSSNEEGKVSSRIWFQGAENAYYRALKRASRAELVRAADSSNTPANKKDGEG